MTGPWLQSNKEYVEVHMREMLARAEQDRLGRRTPTGHPLRYRLGALLIAAGRAMEGPALAACNADEPTYRRVLA